MVKKKPTNELVDFYKRMPSEFKPKYHNPSFQNHLMGIPFRGLVVGSSGSGKTSLVFEILSRMTKTFSLIVLCCKQGDEPLYKWLRSKVDPDLLHVYEDGEVPPLDTYRDFDGQVLLIFDDLVNEKDQSLISEWFIRGRKLAKGVSMLYLTQSYFKTPKTVRLQCNYIFLKKLSSTRDLQMILSDFNLGVSKDDLLEKYKTATSYDRKDFLMIDIDEVPEKRFRFNFLNIL